MSYIPEFSFINTQSIGEMLAPSAFTADSRIPCGSISHSGVTVNTDGQLELSAGNTYLIQASTYIELDGGTGSLEARWYDVTNGGWLGRSQKTWVSTGNQTQLRTTLSRFAIETSGATTVELRLVSTATASRINTHVLAAGYGGRAWYSVISF